MKWLNDLRTKLGGSKLLKNLKGVNKTHRFINMDEAENIGILFEGTNESFNDIIHSYIKKLHKNKKEVHVLAYWSKKDIPDNPLKRLEINYFTKRDLNFKLIPNLQFVKNFINKDFDILISVNAENSFPLKYISALSNATMRIGAYQKDSTPFYDLMVNQKDNENIKEYFNQIDHYLNIINKNAKA